MKIAPRPLDDPRAFIEGWVERPTDLAVVGLATGSSHPTTLWPLRVPPTLSWTCLAKLATGSRLSGAGSAHRRWRRRPVR